MLFLGVLSVFQLILIPGLLIIPYFPAKRSFIQQLAYIFMLSLLANYAAVLLLVAAGLYTRLVVLTLFTAEFVLLLWINRARLMTRVGGKRARIKQKISVVLDSLADWSKKDFLSAALYIIFGALAILGIVWALSIWVNNLGTVFQKWDSWASWDRWAGGWAQNKFPGDTWEYPQLIPVSLSMAYKFIGTTTTKFFGKSIMPLFTLFIGLMLFDLGRKYRSYGYMLGAGLALYSIYLFLGEYIPEVYADLPVACFSLMAIYTLLKADRLSDKDEIRQTLLLGSLSTAAAAVTKQTGLYVMIFYPMLAYFWVLRGQKKITSREAFALLGKHLLLVFVLVVPWYALMEYRIFYGGNTSNIQYVINDIYKGETLPQRLIAATVLLGNYVYWYLFILASLIVLNNRFRQIVVFIVLPFSILWALFLSYEPRNLAVAFPLISLTSGVALEKWAERFSLSAIIKKWSLVSAPLIKKLSRTKIPFYAIILMTLFSIAAATAFFTDNRIVERQLDEQKKIFEPTLNEKMYRYFSRNHGPQLVITNYPLDWLPGFENIWINEHFENYDTYEQTLLRNPTAELLLVPLDVISPQILSEIQLNIDAGTYELIFTDSNYMFVHIPPRG